MRFVHVGCGGEIDTKKRQCTKCKHKWGRIAFLTTPMEIRQVVESRQQVLERVSTKPVKHAKWAEQVPGATILSKILPNWPRWARILATVGFVVVVVLVIYLIWWG